MMTMPTIKIDFLGTLSWNEGQRAYSSLQIMDISEGMLTF